MVYYTVCNPIMAEYESEAHTYISKYGSIQNNVDSLEKPMKCSSHEYAEALRQWMHSCDLTRRINDSQNIKYPGLMQSQPEYSIIQRRYTHTNVPLVPIVPSISNEGTNNNNNEQNS